NPLGSDADALYFGDVRAGGATRVGGTGSGLFSTADLFISQVAVYTTALTPQQILDISEFMQNNPNGVVSVVPEPGTLSLTLLGIVSLALARRRRDARS
ncbi:MAG: PEP-CTERM sorting domain-containing protein, partial [Pirellulales bacterium]|nr:PEP-CTERM sorting domain-containing protein [Pirellulales bacterium]